MVVMANNMAFDAARSPPAALESHVVQDPRTPRDLLPGRGEVHGAVAGSGKALMGLQGQGGVPGHYRILVAE